MFCPKCYTPVEPKYRYCPNCGTSLHESEEDSRENEKKEKKKKIKQVILAVVGVALFVLIIRFIDHRNKMQRVTQASLNSIEKTIQEEVQMIRDYYDHTEEGWTGGLDAAARKSTDLEMEYNDFFWSTEGHWTYYAFRDRRGWEDHEYMCYDALFIAYDDLTDFYGDHKYIDDEDEREEYETLIRFYEKKADEVREYREKKVKEE